MTTEPFMIRALDAALRPAALAALTEAWGTPLMVSRGVLYDVSEFPGFVALRADTVIGVVTYRMDGLACEVLMLLSLSPGIGVGQALMDAAAEAARAADCTRLWLITTNDNIRALKFYQQWGMQLAALHTNALAESRRLKPQIPLVGMHGIPLRDEIELELML